MDIAALSSAMKHSSLKQQVGVSVLKMAMDASEVQIENIEKMLEESTKLMELSVNPELGGNIDITV